VGKAEVLEDPAPQQEVLLAAASGGTRRPFHGRAGPDRLARTELLPGQVDLQVTVIVVMVRSASHR
jgi:hypothetical protein